MNKKILVIGNGQSVLIKDLYKNINKQPEKISIGLFSLNPIKTESNIFKNIYSFPSFFFKITNPSIAFILKVIYLKIFTVCIYGKYNILHMHYVQNIYNYIKPKKIADKSIITVWGSDFLRRNEKKLNKLKKLFQNVDIVSCGNKDVLDKVGLFYKLDTKKLIHTPFGFEALDYIEKYKSYKKEYLKKSFNFPENAICIALGYNADSGQQHEKILDSISKNKSLIDLKDQLFFIVPMTYGERQKGYINNIENKLKKFPFKSVVFKEFMNTDTIAQFRLSCDILIQVQVTDLLAGSMQEHLCAGNIVITGSWLPYQILKSHDIKYKEVDKIEECGDMLKYILENSDDIKANNNFIKILKLSSWKYTIYKWIKLYS